MKRRILYLLPSLDYGGAEMQSIAQLNALYQQDCEVYLLLLSAKKQLINELYIPKENICILNFPYHILTFVAIKNCFSILQPLAHHILEKKIDVIVAHLPLAQFVARLTKIIYRQNFQLIAYHHSISFNDKTLNTLGKRLFNRLHSWLAYWADDQNICVSEATKQNLQAHFCIHQPRVIWNSVPFRAITIEAANSYLVGKGLTDRKYTILLPGRLHPVKGHAFLLQAFQKLHKKYNWQKEDILLLIVGGGNLAPTLHHQINQLQLANWVHLTGFVSNDLLLSFYKIADLVVIPSLREAFGIVAIEALMQKSLVLCSDAGGLPEIIQDGRNGFVFPKGNEQAFIQKFDYLYQHRNKILIEPAVLWQDYQKRFTLAAQIKRLLKIIDNKKK